MRRVVFVMVLLAVAQVDGVVGIVTSADSGVTGAEKSTSRWWSHVAALAGDDMEGRETGSAAHRRAADYVATQFRTAGLEPAGSVGYIQPVTFKTRRIVEAQSSLALIRDGTIEPLALGSDANLSMRIDPASSVEAPIVFVGFGLRIPELGIDDLRSLDLNGAVVVHFAAVPASLPGPQQAHFGSNAERWKMYRAAGAIGTIGVASPTGMEIPWERSTLARLQPQMSLADRSLDEYTGQQLAVTMNPAKAEKLFAGSGHTFREVLTLAAAGNPVPHFRLQARIKATVQVDRSEVESQNVVGALRGSDPSRRDEYVVLSAHLDHLGVGQPINGDRIYNGAMDNASGVAAILEVAARLRESGARPRRSLLFVAVTGEEKGDLGSRYFAAHPPVARSALVANINTDMFLPLFPLKTLMVLGLDESDLADDIRAVARDLGLSVQADPEPQRSRFVRSDQYSFVTAGIPALAMKVGYDERSPEAAVARKWTAERYHAPSDDLNQPVDISAAEKFVAVVGQLALHVADRPDRPTWNESSFFKRFAKGRGE